MNDTKLKNLHLLVENNHDSDALKKLISYYNEENKYDELAKLYLHVLEKNKFDAKALNNLAVIYADYYQDYDKAKQFYEKTLQLEPNEANVHFNYGVILEANFNEFYTAREHYLKAIEIDNKYVDAYINLSRLYLRQFSDLNTSYIVVKEALKYVEDTKIYAQIAYIEMKKYKELDKAYKNLEKALELDNKNDLALTYLGQLYIIKKNYDLAKKTFAKVIELNRVNELLIYEYGKLLIQHYKDFNGAIKVLEKAVEFYPEKVVYYCYLANLHFVLGHISEAKSYLKQAEDFVVTNQEALLMIGYLKVMLNEDKEGALMYFEKVIELNPNNINALTFIGFYNLMNNEHIEIALDYFIKIAEISQEYFIVNFIVAQIYLQYYHDSTQALAYLLKINADNLNNFDLAHLYYLIGNIYELHENNNMQALEYYERAYLAKPDKFLKSVIEKLYENDKTIIN